MAKFKPAGSRKAKTPAKAGDNRAVVPCAILVLGGFALIFWLMYALMTAGK
jgi:hypothetical protein